MTGVGASSYINPSSGRILHQNLAAPSGKDFAKSHRDEKMYPNLAPIEEQHGKNEYLSFNPSGTQT